MDIQLNIFFKYDFWKEHVSTKRRVDILKMREKQELRQWVSSCFYYNIKNMSLHENLDIKSIHFDFWSNGGGYGRITFHRDPLAHLSLREIRQLMTEYLKKIVENVKEVHLDENYNETNFVPGNFHYFIKINEPLKEATMSFSDVLVRDYGDRNVDSDKDKDKDKDNEDE